MARARARSVRRRRAAVAVDVGGEFEVAAAEVLDDDIP
jgi:hypothetical protein